MKFKVGDFIEDENKFLGFITSVEKEGVVVEWEKYKGEEQFHFQEDMSGWMLSLRSFNRTKTAKTPICIHHWQRYEGFTESYDFCRTCGIKGKIK